METPAPPTRLADLTEVAIARESLSLCWRPASVPQSNCSKQLCLASCNSG